MSSIEWPDHLLTLADWERLPEDERFTVEVVKGVMALSPRIDAAKVLLAVEVASDRTRRVDRVTKFAEYAEAGIPQCWLIDLDQPVTLTAFQLVDDTYELDGEFVGNVRLRVDGHPVVLDLDQLTAR